MVIKVEERRGRIIVHLLNRLKLEWNIEPRYWRNPLIAIVLWIFIPFLISYIYYTPYKEVMKQVIGLGAVTLLSSLVMANVIALSAIAHSFQTIGTGRVNFGPQFFFVIGGFMAALLNKNFGLGPEVTFFASFAFPALVGLALSPLTIISRGLYFTLITLILPLILRELIFWRSDIFGAETGIPGIAALVSTGDFMNDTLIYFYLSLTMVITFLFIVDKILRSRWGIMLGVINEDEEVASSFGIDVKKIKIVVFTLTSGVMGLSGWFIAHYYGSFAGTMWLEPWLLIFILLSSVLGGKGAIYGAVLGAYFIILSRDILRTYIGGGYALLVLYIALLIALYLLPEGLWGLYRKARYREYIPTIRIRRKL